jgi:serine/threonine protein phosphatase PrpC
MTVFKNCILISGQGPRYDMQDHGIHFTHPRSKNSLFLVTDGIGGQPNGSDAARITIECLKEYFQKTDIEMDIGLFKQWLKIGLQKVQQQLAIFIDKHPAAQIMGCALCGILVSDKNLHLFWSGDCRLFIIRKGKIIYTTIPHTWAFDLFRRGEFSEEEASWSPQNFLTASINAHIPELRYDIDSLKL